jgi:hypothetical protein
MATTARGEAGGGVGLGVVATVVADSIQYATREGPCLEAVEGHDVARVADLAIDQQWPAFARRCVGETKVRSMFSLRLFLSSDARAALNFYAERPGANVKLRDTAAEVAETGELPELPGRARQPDQRT